MDDLRVTRDRHLDLQDAIDRADVSPPDGGRSLVGVTDGDGAYPTVASRFYKFLPHEITGGEQEGDTATLVDAGDPIYAWNCGTQVPPEGTTLVVHMVGGKWVFRFDG